MERREFKRDMEGDWNYNRGGTAIYHLPSKSFDSNSNCKQNVYNLSKNMIYDTYISKDNSIPSHLSSAFNNYNPAMFKEFLTLATFTASKYIIPRNFLDITYTYMVCKFYKVNLAWFG